MFKLSPLFKAVKEDYAKYFPDPKYHLAGDSAYNPPLTWIMPAYKRPKNGHLPPSRRRFNTKLSKGRVKIENAFGFVKGRWRCLLNLLTRIPRAVQIVYVCTVLHNFCLLEGDFLDDFVPEPTSDDPEPMAGVDALDGGRGDQKRENISNTL